MTPNFRVRLVLKEGSELESPEAPLAPQESKGFEAQLETKDPPPEEKGDP